MTSSLIEQNAKANMLRGLGGWRALYLEFIKHMRPDSLVEIGSGDPAFLIESMKHIKRATGIDANQNLKELYSRANIDLELIDFNQDQIPTLATKYDVAVCSDVFEHLLFPDRVLSFIETHINERGVLFSHVPNEYSLNKTLKVMLGLRQSVYFHKSSSEWDNPHLRRFTEKGYENFLKQAFSYNLKLTDLRYNRMTRMISRLGLSIPYCLQGGPTYASTKDLSVYQSLKAIKEKLHRKRGILG
ncbi:MAG: class I SAM-dependent methyltransferase [Syntrophaceae bacterium]|nr:class I SAM-dependent methyltransferase [Syntrophaceae bacterium]